MVAVTEELAREIREYAEGVSQRANDRYAAAIDAIGCPEKPKIGDWAIEYTSQIANYPALFRLGKILWINGPNATIETIVGERIEWENCMFVKVFEDVRTWSIAEDKETGH